jgi:hypothetical protein
MKNIIFKFLFIKIIYLLNCLFTITQSYSNKFTITTKGKTFNKEENKNKNFLKSNKFTLSKTNLNLNLKSKALLRSQMLSLKSLFSTSNSNSYKELNSKLFKDFPKVIIDLKNTDDVGKGPIYFKGWNKYFILRNFKGLEMKDFIYNDAYKKEQRDNFMKNHKENLDLSIPNELSFYFVLTDDYLSSVSSRYVNINKYKYNYDLIYIANINYINDVNNINDINV